VAAGVALMYYPGHWQPWVTDGVAHANLCMALWLCAFGFILARRRPRDPMLEWGNAAACAFNCLIVVMHVLIWRYQMGV